MNNESLFLGIFFTPRSLGITFVAFNEELLTIEFPSFARFLQKCQERKRAKIERERRRRKDRRRRRNKK